MGSKPPRCRCLLSFSYIRSRRLESHQPLPGFNRALCSLSYRAFVLEPTGRLELPSPGYEAGALPVELYRRGSVGRLRTCKPSRAPG